VAACCCGVPRTFVWSFIVSDLPESAREGVTVWLCPRCGWGRVGGSYGGRCRNAFSDECQDIDAFSMLERVEMVPRDHAEALAHAVSESLPHGEDSPLATALKTYLAEHPWSDL
jgi:hypothetical protein